jgi:hypothetical protein
MTTDAEELFISQKLEKYLKKCMANVGRWVYLSPVDCTPKHRPEIAKRLQEVLTLMGVQFSWENQSFSQRNGFKPQKPTKYKIKILSEEDIQRNKQWSQIIPAIHPVGLDPAAKGKDSSSILIISTPYATTRSLRWTKSVGEVGINRQGKIFS